MHTVSIHQPEFMPYLGFFHKMNMANTFVLLDNVQFKKNNYQNRNRINSNGQALWIGLPIEKHALSTSISNIKINQKTLNAQRLLKTIQQNYSKTPYFDDIFPFIQSLFIKNHQKLSDFNIEFIEFMKHKLGIESTLLIASELPLSGKAQGGTEVTLEICKLLNANVYISGSGGKAYLDLEKYKDNDIEVVFQHFNHPIYSQINTKEFIPYLSIIDLYFHHGKKSLEIIMEQN